MELVQEIIERYGGHPELLLVALQELQERAGYVPDAATGPLARSMGLPEGEVLGVISFYSELRTAPPGRHRVCVCGGDSCAAAGSRHIAEAVESHLGARAGTTTLDGEFSYDAVYCLGNCALSPSISIDSEVYGRATPEGVRRQLEELADA